jgi:hypothetical protein
LKLIKSSNIYFEIKIFKFLRMKVPSYLHILLAADLKLINNFSIKNWEFQYAEIMIITLKDFALTQNLIKK